VPFRSDASLCFGTAAVEKCTCGRSGVAKIHFALVGLSLLQHFTSSEEIYRVDTEMLDVHVNVVTGAFHDRAVRQLNFDCILRYIAILVIIAK